MVAERSSATLRWFRNPINQPGTNWAPRTISTTATQLQDVAAADLDGDGDLDVATVQSNGLYIWLNTDGLGQAWTGHEVTTNFLNAQRLIAADFDQDGRPDLAVTEYGGTRVSVFYWPNLSFPGIWQRRNIPNNFPGALGLAAGDLDDDGDLDLVAASQSGGAIHWWAKSGYADLQISKTAQPSAAAPGQGVTFRLTVTNGGPQVATNVVAVDALPGEFIWVSDTAGAGLPSGTNLVWNIGTLLPGQAVTCLISALVSGSAPEVTVTNRAGVTYPGADEILSNNLAGAAVQLSLLTGTVFTNVTGLRLVAAGRLNVDPWADVVAWSTAGVLQIAYNDIPDVLLGAGPWFNRTNIAAVSAASDLLVADVNGDGRGEPLVAAGPWIAWWNLTGPLPVRFNVAALATQAISLAVGDINRDALLDVVAADAGAGTVSWFRNLNGLGISWSSNQVALGLAGPASPVVADVDGDGDPDLLLAVTGAATVLWRDNLYGDGSAWQTRTVDTAVPGLAEVLTADVDRDGDLDVLARGAALTWWENRGRLGQAWTRREIDASLAGVTDTALTDRDRDGDVDVIGSVSTSATLTWWENEDGYGHTWARRTVPGVVTGLTALVAARVDGDAGPDVVGLLPGAGRVQWFPGPEPQWPGFFATNLAYVFATNFLETSAALPLDLDGDGDLDVLASSGDTDVLAWWENLDGRARAWTSRVFATTATNVTRLAHGDFDRDGDSDLATAGVSPGGNFITWWENRGTAWVQRVISTPIGNTTDLAANDVDRDGDLDLVASCDGSSEGIYWARNDLAGLGTWTVSLINNTINNPSTLDAGDVNADGESDLVVGTRDDIIYWLENRGSATSWTIRVAVSSAGVNNYAVRVADLNADGYGDFTFARTGSLSYARYQPATTNFAPIAVGAFPGGVRDAAATDVDGDGDLDVVSVSEDFVTAGPKVSWFEHDPATDSFLEHPVNYTLKGARRIQAADLDQDGDPDLLASASKNSGYITLPDVAWWENRWPARLEPAKTPSRFTLAGPTNLAWTLVVSNGLGMTANNVILTDYLPAGVTWVTNSCGLPAPASNRWTWTIGALPAGAAVSCTVTVQVTTGVVERIRNVARVTANVPGQGGTNETVAAVTAFNALDTDGDGLADSVDPDDDNDGMPDPFEIQYNLNPINPADAGLDGDNDGLNNLAEFIADTIPTNNLSYWEVDGITNTPPARIVFSGSVQRVYTLQFNPDLRTGTWSTVAGQVAVPGAGAGSTLQDAAAATGGFYRVQVHLP